MAFSQKVGAEREMKTENALEALKAAGYIIDFFPTGHLSVQDLLFGVDFQVIYVKRGERVSSQFGVTGPRFEKKDKQRHPDVPVLVVRLSDDLQTVKEKILNLLY